jgi:hypothetical protein
VAEALQTALGIVQEWCDKANLPTLFIKTIQLFSEVKYLGIA